MKTIDIDDIIEHSLEDKRLQLEADMARIQSEIQRLHSSDKFCSPIVKEREVENLSQTNGLDLCSENFIMCDKLLEDNIIYGEEEGEEWAKQQNDTVQELEKFSSEVTAIQRYDFVQALSIISFLLHHSSFLECDAGGQMRNATGVSDTLIVTTHVGLMMEGARAYHKSDRGVAV